MSVPVFMGKEVVTWLVSCTAVFFWPHYSLELLIFSVPLNAAAR